MTPKKNRLFWRVQRPGDPARAYGNFRDYSDVGGRRKEALIPIKSNLATTDPDIAIRLLNQKLEDYEKKRRDRAILNIEGHTTLRPYIRHHLLEMAKEGKVEDHWIIKTEGYLQTSLGFFGDVELLRLAPKDMKRFWDHLAAQEGRGKFPDGTKRTLAAGTIRHYLNALSGLFSRAQSDEAVPMGHNPVEKMYRKPAGTSEEAVWMEIDQAALLLSAARDYKVPKSQKHLAFPFIYPVVATFLLTGARKSEILGLEKTDISLERRSITFRENEWRRLKTKPSYRTIPLWPQLEEILREYLQVAPEGELLFPTLRAEKHQPISDFRKQLNALVKIIGWEKSRQTKVFRHTYCAARLQTLDQGKPVSIYTVSRELGHGTTAMVQRVYAHLGEIRHRSEVVEYRLQLAEPHGLPANH